MEYVIEETGKPFPEHQVLRMPRLPRGDEQTALTIAAMSGVVDASAEQDLVRTYAVEVCRPGRARPGELSRFSAAHVAQRLYVLGRSVVRFRADPRDVEYLRLPAAMIADIQRDGHVAGDCDEAAMLACALAKAVGLRPAFVTLARSAAGPFMHVLPALLIGDEVLPFDAQEGFGPGTWPPAARRVVWPVGHPDAPETKPRSV